MAAGRDSLILQNAQKNRTRDKVRHRGSKSAHEQQVCEPCRMPSRAVEHPVGAAPAHGFSLGLAAGVMCWLVKAN